MSHLFRIKRDGTRWWYWSCSCGAEGASHTTPYDARQAAAEYHPQGAERRPR